METPKLAEWASEHSPITKIGLSDGRGGKNIPTAVQFGYGRSGFGGYLGNVGSVPEKFKLTMQNLRPAMARLWAQYGSEKAVSNN